MAGDRLRGLVVEPFRRGLLIALFGAAVAIAVACTRGNPDALDRTVPAPSATSDGGVIIPFRQLDLAGADLANRRPRDLAGVGEPDLRRPDLATPGTPPDLAGI